MNRPRDRRDIRAARLRVAVLTGAAAIGLASALTNWRTAGVLFAVFLIFVAVTAASVIPTHRKPGEK